MNKLYFFSKMRHAVLVLFALLNFAVKAQTPIESLNFDGSNDHIVVDNTIALSGNYTFEGWIKRESFGHQTIISKWDDDANKRAWMINFGEYGNGKELFVVHSTPDWFTSHLQWATGFEAELDKWYHIAVTFDASLPSANIKLYVNGNLYSSVNYALMLTPNNANLYIGAYDGSGNGLNTGASERYFDGSMRHVSLWTTTRSASEIQSDMCGITGAVPGLEFSYPLNDGVPESDNSSITTVADVSGNNRNGTLMNFALNGTSSNWINYFHSAVMLSPDPVVNPNFIGSGYAYASSEFPSNPSYQAFDGDVNTGWVNYGALPASLEYDFGSGVTYSADVYSLYFSSQMYNGWNSNIFLPGSWRFEGFDGTDWDTLDIQNNVSPVQDAWNTYTIANPSLYQRYRIVVTGSQQGAFAVVSEMKVARQSPYCGPRTFVVSNTTNDAAPSIRWYHNGNSAGTGNQLVLSSYNYGDSVYCVVNAMDACFGMQNFVTGSQILNGTKFDTAAVTLCYGEQFLTSGIHVFNDTIIDFGFRAVTGCDSLVHFNVHVLPQLQSTVNAVLCYGDAFTPAGIQLYADTLISRTYTGITGCDSVVHYNIHVLPQLQATVVATLCYGDVFAPAGIQLFADTLISRVYTGITGCDSVVYYNVHVNPQINTGVATNGFTIVALGNADTYQWINCAGASLLNGETNQIFTAAQNGMYAVVLSSNGCADTSACIAINAIGLEEINETATAAVVYPNPSTGMFNVSSEISLNTVTIYNSLGELVLTNTTKEQHLQFDLSGFSSGIYFVHVNGRILKLIRE